MIRAKFQVTEIKKSMTMLKSKDGAYVKTEINEVTLNPVTTGSKENEEFFAWTPSGKITIGATKEVGFELDKEYYVDFTKAEPI